MSMAIRKRLMQGSLLAALAACSVAPAGCGGSPGSAPPENANEAAYQRREKAIQERLAKTRPPVPGRPANRK